MSLFLIEMLLHYQSETSEQRLIYPLGKNGEVFSYCVTFSLLQTLITTFEEFSKSKSRSNSGDHILSVYRSFLMFGFLVCWSFDFLVPYIDFSFFMVGLWQVNLSVFLIWKDWKRYVKISICFFSVTMNYYGKIVLHAVLWVVCIPAE